MIKYSILVFYLLVFFSNFLFAQKMVYIDELDLSHAEQDDYPIQSRKNIKGNAIALNRVEYERGIGTYTNSMFHIDLKKGSSTFSAIVGFDDEVIGQGCHPIEFIVYADDKIAWRSGVMNPTDAPRKVLVNVENTTILSLYVKSVRGKWNGFSAWADAKLTVVGQMPESYIRTIEDFSVLTPKALSKVQINGPEITGVRPNSPFQYYIPVSGERPIQYSAENLPDGLVLDSKTGIITGRVSKNGTYPVKFIAKNSKGISTRNFKIIVGDNISLTPPMGWSSWNVWGANVSHEKVKNAADALKSSGLIDYGWTYVNIDDGWQDSIRGGKYNAIQSFEKFPDMKGLCDYIHEAGLKAGIYSTPWSRSYAQRIGSSADCADGTSPYYDTKSYRIEFGLFPFYEADVRQWAEWGFDYLKLDWFPNTVPHTIEFKKAIDNSGRDFVYSLSNAAPIEQVNYWQKYSNLWRTTGDIVDSWGSIYSILSEQEKWAKFGGPGHWNDPDMLVVGWLGWGKELHSSKLTPIEQYAHISLWALLSAPLLLGADLTQLDDFTFNLLSNSEVIAIDQDQLGKPVKRIKIDDLIEVWVKEMYDGSMAVGMCNFGIATHSIRVNWNDLGINGKYMLRDVWKQQDIGIVSDFYEKDVKPHGVLLLKFTKN